MEEESSFDKRKINEEELHRLRNKDKSKQSRFPELATARISRELLLNP